MGNLLPKIQIVDVPFYIDIVRLELRQVGKPGNRLSFKDIQNEGDHLVILFDKRTKNAFKGTWGEFTSSHTVTAVKLPSFYELDPERMAKVMWKNNPNALASLMVDSNPQLDRLKTAIDIIIKAKQNVRHKRFPKL